MIKYICIIIVCSQCTYQFPINIIQNYNNILSNTHITVILHSYEPCNTITHAIQKELYLNNINIINHSHEHTLCKNSNKNIFLLKILCAIEDHIVVSLFQDGTESEYKIILEIKAKYCNTINTQNYHPINVRVHRTLIKDPNGALSNLVQENEILDLMYIDAAQQLIQKFLMELKISCINKINKNQ